MEFVSGLKKYGFRVGIYTNYNNWDLIVGLSWDELSTLPLWYANYDGQLNFDDFKPFGGWSQPTMKQYSDTTLCGVGVGLNWYP